MPDKEAIDAIEEIRNHCIDHYDNGCENCFFFSETKINNCELADSENNVPLDWKSFNQKYYESESAL